MEELMIHALTLRCWQIIRRAHSDAEPSRTTSNAATP
jgi:hypothetical protein